MAKLFILLASGNGFLAVALGAFAAHVLRDTLDQQLLGTFQTAAQYHMYHSLALLGVGVLCTQFPAASQLRWSGYLFLLGILLFSGSLYLLAITGTRWLGAITPLGGVAFLGGWACLCWFAINQSFPE